MTEKELRQKEIKRLHRKTNPLTEAYSQSNQGPGRLKKEKPPIQKRGRPILDKAAEFRILALCQQGKD